MNKKNLVSVIMCVYNEPMEFVRQAIYSILNQSHKNIEFILINDNPKDEKLDQLIKSILDARIKYYRNSNNLGLTKSLNKGIRMASGDFIARMDADDISIIDRFEAQVKYFNANPNVYVVGGWGSLIDDFGNEIVKIKKKLLYEEILVDTLFETPFIHVAVMFRKEVFTKYKMYYNDSFILAQDYELFSRLVPRFEVINLPIVVVKYRMCQNGLSRSRVFEQTDFFLRALKSQLNNLGIELSEKDMKLLRLMTRNINNESVSLIEIKSLRILLSEIYKTMRNNANYDSQILSNVFLKKFGNMINYLQNKKLEFGIELYKLEKVLDGSFLATNRNRIVTMKKLLTFR